MRLETILFESPASRKTAPVLEGGGGRGGEDRNNGTIAQTDPHIESSHQVSSVRPHQLQGKLPSPPIIDSGWWG